MCQTQATTEDLPHPNMAICLARQPLRHILLSLPSLGRQKQVFAVRTISKRFSETVTIPLRHAHFVRLALESLDRVMSCDLRG